MEGITIDGKQLNHLRYADNIVLITDDPAETVCMSVGLEINISKTKMMINLVPSEKLKLRVAEIDITDNYVYLGYEVRISRGNQTTKMQGRNNHGWAAYGSLRDDILIKLKSKAFNQCVLPVLTYGNNGQQIKGDKNKNGKIHDQNNT